MLQTDLILEKNIRLKTILVMKTRGICIIGRRIPTLTALKLIKFLSLCLVWKIPKCIYVSELRLRLHNWRTTVAHCLCELRVSLVSCWLWSWSFFLYFSSPFSYFEQESAVFNKEASSIFKGLSRVVSCFTDEEKLPLARETLEKAHTPHTISTTPRQHLAVTAVGSYFSLLSLVQM